MKNDSPSACSDEQLMRAYLEGDVMAFELLYERHAGRVYAFIRGRIRGEEEQNDVLQEVFLKLHRFRHRYCDSLPFLPWLFAVTRSALVDHIRKTARRREELRDPVEPVFELAAEPSETSVQSSLTQPLEALSDRQRKILSLRYQQDLTYEQIGKRLGIDSSLGRQIASRAIRKLRSLLGVDDG